jgi:hypothetical protein
MKYGDAEEKYELYMVSNYGKEFVESLIFEKRAKRPYKWNRCELEDLLDEINSGINMHQKRVCG